VNKMARFSMMILWHY